MIYPPNQKPPIWSIDPGVIAYNCQQAGFPHPVGAWPFWEGAGNLARDCSGNGNHGTISGAVWNAQGVEFSSDSINVGEGNGLFDFGTGDFSIFTIFQRNSVSSSYETIFGKWAAGFPVQYWIRLATNNTMFGGHRSETEGRWYIHSSTAINNTDIHKIIYQRNSDISNYQFFLNGVDVTVNGQQQIAYNTNVDNDADAILGSNGIAAEYFNGSVYNTIVFKTSLTYKQSKFINDNPYFMYQIPEELYGYVAGAPPVGAIMNPFQKTNLGADLYNGAIIA